MILGIAMVQRKGLKKNSARPAIKPITLYVGEFGKVLCPKLFAEAERPESDEYADGKECLRHVDDCKYCPFKNMFGSERSFSDRRLLTVECNFYGCMTLEKRASYGIAAMSFDGKPEVLADPDRLTEDAEELERVEKRNAGR